MAKWHCKSWKELEDGLQLSEDDGRRLLIFYPSHAACEVYDVIVLYTDERVIKEKAGHQCKEGKSPSKHPPIGGFSKSFVLKGETPAVDTSKSGWTIPVASEIEEFFGVSGKHWTPSVWRRLAGSNPGEG